MVSVVSGEMTLSVVVWGERVDETVDTVVIEEVWLDCDTEIKDVCG